MNRGTVIVDDSSAKGTQPAGSPACSCDAAARDPGVKDAAGATHVRQGVEAYRVSGVSIENLTVCNYLDNEIWWNNGDGRGVAGPMAILGDHITATSTFHKDARNAQNNDDAPSPQLGQCVAPSTPPAGAVSGNVWRGNDLHDNNNPNTPGSGLTAVSAIGSGVELVATQHITVVDNVIRNQGSWGVVAHDFPDPEQGISNCGGGVPANVGDTVVGVAELLCATGATSLFVPGATCLVTSLTHYPQHDGRCTAPAVLTPAGDATNGVCFLPLGCTLSASVSPPMPNPRNGMPSSAYCPASTGAANASAAPALPDSRAVAAGSASARAPAVTALGLVGARWRRGRRQR